MQSKSLTHKFVLAAAMVAVVAGCSTIKETVHTDAKSAGEAIAARQADFRATVTASKDARIAAQDVGLPYLAGNAQPLARGASMPAVLQRSATVTALFQRGPVDLETALRQVGEAAGILLTATPDALLPPSAFAPRSGEQSSTVQAPPRVQVLADAVPLWTLLDDIARQAGVSWRPAASGAEFFRVETRTFALSALPMTATTSVALGRNGGNNSVFSSESKSGFAMKDQDQMKGILTTVDALLTKGGKAVISPENQTLVVTDTPAALARVETFVKAQNRALSRRVRLVLEAIEVADRNLSEFGVDWSMLYGATEGALKSSTVGSLVSAQAASLSTTVGTGAFKDTSLVIKALNEVGVVVSRRSFPMLTTSGRPVTQAIRSTFNYVDQVQVTGGTASSSTTVVQAPTVTQKDETTGTFVTVVPNARPDGTIFLALAYDLTSAQPLVPFTVGSSGSSVTVQQKTIDGTGFVQEVPIRSGQTVVVGGIETITGQDTIRRLGAGAPIAAGGSDLTKLTKTRMVLLVTAVAEEGI